MAQPKLLTYNGEAHPITVWAARQHLKPSCIYQRLAYGWSVEKTLTTPVQDCGAHRHREGSKFERAVAAYLAKQRRTWVADILAGSLNYDE